MCGWAVRFLANAVMLLLNPLWSLQALQSEAEIDEAFAVYQNRADYFRQAFGSNPLRQTVMDDAREATDSEQSRLYYGLLKYANDTVGVLGCLTDYPATGFGYIRLFVLRSEYEGKGLAAEGYRAVEQWMRKQNMHTIRLLVLAKNRRGQQFWLKMGFVKAGEKYIHLHQQEHRVWRMEKCLSEK